MADQETPESLYQFFAGLDTGEVESDSPIDYASSGVVRRGMEAARRLVAIQNALGAGAGTPATGASAAPADLESIRLNLEEERRQADALRDRNQKLETDVDRLRGHIQMLQRQINRIYDRREMSSVLGRIEAGPTEQSGTPEPPQPPAADAPPPSAATIEKPETGTKVGENKAFLDAMDFESAIPVRDLPPQPEGEQPEDAKPQPES